MERQIFTTFLLCLFTLFGCSKEGVEQVQEEPILYRDLYRDDSTMALRVRKTKEVFTGRAANYMYDSLTGKYYLEILRIVRDGIIDSDYLYHPNGNLKLKAAYNKDGKINGVTKTYYEDGKLKESVSFVDGKMNGEAEFFPQSGGFKRVSVYKDDSLITSKWYDESGKRVITVFDKLELVGYKTGFYNFTTPMVVMKLKNILGKPLSEDIVIDAIFVCDNEEIGRKLDYFQFARDIPLGDGIAKQIDFKADTQFGAGGYKSKKVECTVYINKTFFKKFSIENDVLFTNRM